MEIYHVVRRDDSSSTSLSPTLTSLIIALLCLLFTSLLLITALFLLRAYRRRRRTSKDHTLLPTHNASLATVRLPSHRRSLSISTSPVPRSMASHVYCEKLSPYDEEFSMSEKASLMIPEIRITFPEEEDEAGKRVNGRVVVVKIGEKDGVGLEPCEGDAPPKYERAGGWKSLDLERIGGLRETENAGEKMWA